MNILENKIKGLEERIALLEIKINKLEKKINKSKKKSDDDTNPAHNLRIAKKAGKVKVVAKK